MVGRRYVVWIGWSNAEEAAADIREVVDVGNDTAAPQSTIADIWIGSTGQ